MKKSSDTALGLSTDYRQFVSDLKSRIANARLSAARHVNRELVTLYWDIGRGIVEKQKDLNWGESVVEMVAAELRAAFPDLTGFSARSVWEMKRLYEAYSAPDFLSQVVRELSNPTFRPILQQPVAEWARAQNGDNLSANWALAKVCHCLWQKLALPTPSHFCNSLLQKYLGGTIC